MITLPKQARTAEDAVEERGPVSQQLQEGGHLCPKTPKEVIVTVTLGSLPPQACAAIEGTHHQSCGWFEG